MLTDAERISQVKKGLKACIDRLQQRAQKCPEESEKCKREIEECQKILRSLGGDVNA